ncbi:MAG: NUDIX domain-containing protein [Candidatus Sungbacteria bacterium]|nr:NUDIX domain-containing protein [Candidatus Sungbacteria bacterium]
MQDYCGKKLAKIKAKPKLKDYVLVVTCVVIRKVRGKGPKVLIIKRSMREKEGPGLWGIPGGRITPADWIKLDSEGLSHELWVGALKRACCRELKEETSLMAPVLNLLVGEERLFFRKSGEPSVFFTFWTQKTQWGKVCLDKGGLVYKWISPKDLEKYSFIGDVKNIIKIALNFAAMA